MCFSTTDSIKDSVEKAAACVICHNGIRGLKKWNQQRGQSGNPTGGTVGKPEVSSLYGSLEIISSLSLGSRFFFNHGFVGADSVAVLSGRIRLLRLVRCIVMERSSFIY